MMPLRLQCLILACLLLLCQSGALLGFHPCGSAAAAQMVPSTLSGHAGPVDALAYSPDGRTLASGSWDESIKIWDAASGSLLRTLSGHASFVTALAYSPDGRTLVSGSSDNTIMVWDAASGSLLRTLSGHANYVMALAYSPDARTLVSGSCDNSIKVWDAASGSLLRTLSGHAYGVNALAYSPDGRTLASGSADKTIGVWDAASGSLLRTLSGHTSAVCALAYSPDGRTLASGSDDKSIKVWDAASGSLLRTLSVHADWVYALAYSPDGRTLASCSRDNTIKVLDAASGSLLRTLSAEYASPVYTLKYNPDGRTLASGSKDKTIRVWPLRSDDVLCQYAPGNDSAVAVAEGSNNHPSDTTSRAETEQQRQARIRARAQELAQEALRKRQTEEEDARKLADQILAQQNPTENKTSTGSHEPNIKTSANAEPTSSGAANTTTGRKPVKDKWALVIGISKFAHSKTHPNEPAIDLKYAAKDAQDFYSYLITHAHFPKDHVLLLLNEKATRENIMEAFGDKFLPAMVQPDDQVVIYVSTHGTPASKDPGQKNYIVAYDTNPNSLYATGVNMDELYGRVKSGVKTNRALIVMDTCFSGAGVPGSRSIDDCANFDANQVAQGVGHLVLSSSAPNEKSWESKVSPNGVFTKYLIQNLQLSKGNLSSAYEKLCTDVQWEVKSAFNQSQHPKLGGKWEGDEFILSVPPTEHRPVLNPDLYKLMAPASASNVPSPKVTTPSKPKQK